MTTTSTTSTVEDEREGSRFWRSAGALAGVGGVVGYVWFAGDGTGPVTCPFKMVTGLDCPLCGGTRAAYQVMHGDIVAAIGYNVFATVILPLAVLVAAVMAVRVRRGNSSSVGLSRLVVGVAFVGVVFCVLRNLPFSSLSWMRA